VNEHAQRPLGARGLWPCIHRQRPAASTSPAALPLCAVSPGEKRSGLRKRRLADMLVTVSWPPACSLASFAADGSPKASKAREIVAREPSFVQNPKDGSPSPKDGLGKPKRACILGLRTEAQKTEPQGRKPKSVKSAGNRLPRAFSGDGISQSAKRRLYTEYIGGLAAGRCPRLFLYALQHYAVLLYLFVITSNTYSASLHLRPTHMSYGLIGARPVIGGG
jgi:hypothetical protein